MRLQKLSLFCRSFAGMVAGLLTLSFFSLHADQSPNRLELAQSDGGVASTESGRINLEDERSRLLNHLKTQIEPNLLQRDLQRLRRNVMRLGSFRAEWVREAEKFLSENSAAAELFLYDFSRIKNPRLNKRILETLLDFKSYQFVSAPFAFSSELADNSEGRKLLLKLYARIVSVQPNIWPEYAQLLLQESDQSPEYFQVFLSACRAGGRYGGELRTQMEDRLSSAPQDFWSRLVVEDLRACLRGV